MSPLVKQMRAERCRQRVSVRVLADWADLDTRGLYKVEAGKASPVLSNFVACVEALGGVVKIEWRE